MKYFQAEPEGHSNAIDLVKQINALNKGQYLDEEMLNSTPTDFCIGVAGYPEKHAESPNLQNDLQHLKAKVDAGAAYIVTQMFFDNQKYFDFVKRCRAVGITVPIIPGLKPVSVRSHLQKLPQTFHIDLPEALVKELQKCTHNKAVRQLGVEWAIAQSKELIAYDVPVIHYYTMGGRSDNILKIAEAVF